MMNITKSLSALLLASISYTMMNIINKIIMLSYAATWQQLAFLRCIIAFIILLGLMLIKKQSLKPTILPLLVLRSISGFLMLLSWMFALKYLPVTNTILLINCAPIFVIIFERVLFKFRINKTNMLCVFLGILGVGLILHPKASHFQSWVSLIALFSGLCLAIGIITIKKLRNTTSGMLIATYYYGLSSIYCLPLAISHWHHLILISWLLVLIAGTISVAYQLLMAKALQHLSSKMASLGLYLAVIFASLGDHYLWQVSFSELMIVGAILIIAQAMISAFSEVKSKPPLAKQSQSA